MTDHSFTTLPARMIRLYGTLAERQIRLMTEVTRMALRPNPMFLALAGVELDRPAPPPPAKPRRARRSPAPQTAAASPRKRARRRPATPPALPDRQG